MYTEKRYNASEPVITGGVPECRLGDKCTLYVRGIEETRPKWKSFATRRGWDAGKDRVNYPLHSEAGLGRNMDDIVW